MEDKPNIIEKLRGKYQYYYTVKFNIYFDEDRGSWMYDIVKLPFGDPTYDTIVDAMISYKYPTDKMQAIINNYLLDREDESANKEFNDMQEWRRFSKEYAIEIMNNF